MNKLCIYLTLLLCAVCGCNTQENSHNLPPEVASAVPQCILPKYADAVLGGKNWDGLKNLSIQDRQAVLISFGYDLGPTGIDGIFGPKTVAAWEAFRATHSGVPTEEDACKIANAIVAYRITTPAGFAAATNSLSQEEREQMVESRKNLPQQPPTTPPIINNQPGDWAKTCPNGSCYGQPGVSGPKTNYVHGYTRQNGTHVGGYYRSHK